MLRLTYGRQRKLRHSPNTANGSDVLFNIAASWVGAPASAASCSDIPTASSVSWNATGMNTSAAGRNSGASGARRVPPHSGAAFMVPHSSSVAPSVGASLISASAVARLAQLVKLPTYQCGQIVKKSSGSVRQYLEGTCPTSLEKQLLSTFQADILTDVNIMCHGRPSDLVKALSSCASFDVTCLLIHT